MTTVPHNPSKKRLNLVKREARLQARRAARPSGGAYRNPGSLNPRKA